MTRRTPPKPPSARQRKGTTRSEVTTWCGIKVIANPALPEGFGMMAAPGSEPVFVINVGNPE